MSFWPFSNANGNSSHLQKFLDSVLDYATVTADNILDDRTLQQEFLEELKNIASKHLKKNSYLYLQPLQNEGQGKGVGNATNSDNISLSSSNPDSSNGGNSLSKNAREQKLLELVLQPHILHGFLDYMVLSVDFFYELERDATDEANGDVSMESEHSTGVDGDESESKKEKLQRCILCAAEVLTTDLWMIANRVIETPDLMGKLWLIISLPRLQERSPAVAYLVQVLDHLMDTNCIEMTNFVRKRDQLVDSFLKKIDIPILMDFFLKIIQTDKADSPTGIIAVLARQELIPKLIDILKPLPIKDGLESSFDQLFMQTSTTEFIKALVTISSNPSLAVDLVTNIGPNELTRELASPRMIEVMVKDIILHKVKDKNNPGKFLPNKHGISNCVSILIELIRKNNSDYDLNCGSYSLQNKGGDGASEVNVQAMFYWLKDFEQNPPGPRDPIYLGDLLEVFSNNFSLLVELMDCDQDVEGVLGLTKFKFSELVAELLHCSNMILLNSKKIANVVKIRDAVRLRTEQNIRLALMEVISDVTSGSDVNLPSITSGVDEMSLEQSEAESESVDSKKNEDFLDAINEDRKLRSLVESLDYEDSEEDEPSVSAENPFVCPGRDEFFRSDPCIGDLFKIKLVDLQMLQKILLQFTKYPWHNFFHNVVFDLVQQIFNGKLNSYNSFLIVELFSPCDIIGLIVDAFREPGLPRPGYMGHLILVSEEVVKFTSLYKPSLISPVIVEAIGSTSWEWFVTDVLLKTRELYNVILGTDPDFSEADDEHQDGGDEAKYGFDSSAVGYMDMDNYDSNQSGSKQPIVLGDSSNHREFVSANPDRNDARIPYDDMNDDGENADDDGDDEEEDHDANGNGRKFRKILDVSIKSMSPTAQFENKDMLYEDHEQKMTLEHEENSLDDFAGSDSSDDDGDDNQLYRVSKHQD